MMCYKFLFRPTTAELMPILTRKQKRLYSSHREHNLDVRWHEQKAAVSGYGGHFLCEDETWNRCSTYVTLWQG